jgi:prolyl 4-hydroxylase
MGADIGVPQIFPAAIHRNRTDVETRIEQAQKYVKFVINKQERYKSVRELCRNNDPKCAQWAVEGWCQEQDEEMTKNCAPVCFACEELHVDAKCPVDPYARNSWYPGDLNKMFHRILRDFADRFDITVLSRPDYAPGDDENSDVDYIIGPWVLTLDGFLSDKEADRFIELGAEGGRGFQRSKGAGKPDEQGYYTQLTSDTQRTSSNNWCNYDACYDDPHSLAVHERIENLTRIPRENAEHLQILRYEQGEFYKTHHDYIPYEKDRQSGPRILTVFLYLNDVEAGGGTNFPGLDLVRIFGRNFDESGSSYPLSHSVTLSAHTTRVLLLCSSIRRCSLRREECSFGRVSKMKLRLRWIFVHFMKLCQSKEVSSTLPMLGFTKER